MRDNINCSLKDNKTKKECQKRPRPFFGYFGGKTKIADKIISKFPKHEVFVEPFVGGGFSILEKYNGG